VPNLQGYNKVTFAKVKASSSVSKGVSESIDHASSAQPNSFRSDIYGKRLVMRQQHKTDRRKKTIIKTRAGKILLIKI
tara:strand:- start:1769 stop:2002 length:234 start_codon:yes stop_codon:yes gene_type:complete